MTENSKQTIKELLSKLPKEAQDVINSIDWIGISAEIGQEYLFEERDINVFQTITGLVLAGMIDPDFYQKRLEEDIGMGSERAKELMDKAMEKIFEPMANKRMQKIKQGSAAKEPAWHQNVDFILSGGNYSAFLEKSRPAEDLGDGPP